MNDIDTITRACGFDLPSEPAPSWWTAKPEQSAQLLGSLKEWRQIEIGVSAGGRPIIAFERGSFDPLPGVTSNNLHSSLSATVADTRAEAIFPESFYGTEHRARPVVVLQGGIHGSELTGTVASLQLCRIVETGEDGRGKPWPELARLAREVDLVVIPWLNPDGVARWPVANPHALSQAAYNALTHGIRKDGKPAPYRENKRLSPLPVDEFAHLGCYFNDAGINLQYDSLMPDRQPETMAWMRYYQRLKPDAVLIWHCNRGTLMGPSEYYVPPGHQHLLDRLAGAHFARLRREGLPVSRLSWVDLPGFGKPVFGQIAGVYHACGGWPVMVELPVGMKDEGFTLDTALDAGLLTIEETLRFGKEEGFRPHHWAGKHREATG